jgi:uncharacterized protein (DUF2147 family)
MKKLPAPMLTIALALALTSSPTAAAAPSPLEGLWSNPNGSVVVRIGPCGEQLCGRVVSASPKARDKAAQGGTNHLIGTTLLSNIKTAGVNLWRGRVFLPKQNTHATGNLRLAGTQLTVHGCLLGIICKNQTWLKVG